MGVGTAVAPRGDADLPGPEVFREWRGGGKLRNTNPRADLFRQCREQIPIPPEDVLGIGDVVQHWSADDHPVLTDRMAAEGEGGDDPEVAAASSQRPEQVRVRVGARGDKATVGQHNVGRHKIVDRKAEAAGQIAHSAAEGQAANPRRGEEARR
jgi:hypothetical protein